MENTKIDRCLAIFCGRVKMRKNNTGIQCSKNRTTNLIGKTKYMFKIF